MTTRVHRWRKSTRCSGTASPTRWSRRRWGERRNCNCRPSNLFSWYSTPQPAVVVQSGAVGNGTSSGGVTEMPESTTTEKYRISRKELGRILNRNFRGLKRLAEIERRDAANVSWSHVVWDLGNARGDLQNVSVPLQATKYNIQEYKVQLANSLQSFVYNLPSKPAN